MTDLRHLPIPHYLQDMRTSLLRLMPRRQVYCNKIEQNKVYREQGPILVIKRKANNLCERKAVAGMEAEVVMHLLDLTIQKIVQVEYGIRLNPLPSQNARRKHQLPLF